MQNLLRDSLSLSLSHTLTHTRFSFSLSHKATHTLTHTYTHVRTHTHYAQSRLISAVPLFHPSRQRLGSWCHQEPSHSCWHPAEERERTSHSARLGPGCGGHSLGRGGHGPGCGGHGPGCGGHGLGYGGHGPGCGGHRTLLGDKQTITVLGTLSDKYSLDVEATKILKWPSKKPN